MINIEVGTKRTPRIPLATGSGTPDSVSIVVTDPSGNAATVATTLTSGYYVGDSDVIFDEAGIWSIAFRAFLSGDATNPEDTKTLIVKAQ